MVRLWGHGQVHTCIYIVNIVPVVCVWTNFVRTYLDLTGFVLLSVDATLHVRDLRQQRINLQHSQASRKVKNV